MTTFKDIEDKYPKPEDECGLRHVHAKAYDYFEAKCFPFFECPWCGEHILYYESHGNSFNFTVVGESNRGTPDEKMYLANADACSKCGEHFAFLPEKIQYNANHDVFYTGGKDYLLDDEGEDRIRATLKDAITPSIDNFMQRLASGESLKPSHLVGWIASKIEKVVAEDLYRRGLKK